MQVLALTPMSFPSVISHLKKKERTFVFKFLLRLTFELQVCYYSVVI